MAFATPENSWLLFVSFSFLIPIGGYWHFISNFQIGNLFGKWQGTIVTIFSGSFDSSSFVFLLFAELYGFGISLHTIFFVYGCASLYLLVNALFFLPRSYIPFPLPQNWTRNYKLKTEISEHESKNETESKLLGGGTGKTSKEEEGGGDEDDSIMVVADDDNNLKEVEIVDCKEEKQEIKMEVEEDKGEDDVDAVAAEDREGSSCSFWRDCVFTWKYSLHVVFVSVNQLKIYIFLSVVLSFLETFEVDQQQFDTMRRTLGVVQLTGIFWSPIVGLIVDRNKRSSSSPKTDTGDCLGDFALPLLITCVLGTVCSANLLVPYASAQYASFFLQVILRGFNYGLAFSFVACNFPPQHIGKLIGLLMAIAATFSSLQYPIIQYVHATATPPSESSSQSCYPPEPTLDYTRVHMLLLLLGVLPFAHPMMVWYQARQKLRKASPKLQDDYVLTDLKRTRTSTA